MLQLSVSEQYLVIKAFGKEQPVFPLLLGVLLCHSNELHRHHLAECLVAGLLYAKQYLAQRSLHLCLYKQDGVQMVGHHL